MTTLQDNLKTQLNKAVFSTGVNNSPAEPVIYNPSGGDARPIQAKVRRDPVDYANAATPGFVITVTNDAVLGISSAEIDAGLDTIDIAPRIGEALETRTIIRIQRHNTAVMVIELN